MSVLITERRSERRSELDTKVGQILNRHPTVGLAVGIIGNGRLQFFGHGLADIASNAPITEDTVFRIGSLTKTFTAVAVMQLWEQGLVDLDVAANDYLNAYKLIPAAHPRRSIFSIQVEGFG
jgi:CubicO group peptidase (beta-lactamase class C family)